MSSADLTLLTIGGFGFCALAYLVLFVLLAMRGRGQGSGSLLLLAVLGEIAFNAETALALFVWGGEPSFNGGFSLQGVLEGLRNLGWVAFMLSLVKSSRLILTAIAALMMAPALAEQLLGARGSTSARVIVAVAAVVCLEQLWRSTAPNRRWAMKFLCLALLAKFSFDLVMYSDALMFGRLDPVWWAAAGYSNALLVPLIAVSAARNRDWKLDVNVSRQVVFHSLTLLSSAAFLLLVAIGGYILKFFGGSPGAVAATMLAFVALLAMIVVSSSGTVRSALRVQLSKHFFSYRYDYRHEWLKLTKHLEGSPRAGDGRGGKDAESAALARRGLNSLMDLVESPGGALWLKDSEGVFHCNTRLGGSYEFPDLNSNEQWIKQLQAEQWIVDLRGGNGAAAFYGPDVPGRPTADAASALPGWLVAHTEGAFLVPLLLDEELIGIALLYRPRVAIDLDWEAQDLLRIAARQVASFLALRRAVEALVQAKQFDSFNRMAAFVVHDLKNLVSQLSLLMRNSERHKGNPEFQEDMLDTVRNVLQRMQGLLLQLGTGAKPVDAPRAVIVSEAIGAAVQSRRLLKPVIDLQIDPTASNLQVTAHQERLERVLGHLIQNAAEASHGDARVLVHARREGSQAVIGITDTGHGMSEDFVREQLFHPFSSTKTGGMGIGAFESREYIREMSGSMDVVSKPGVGSTFTIRLPIRLVNRPPLELALSTAPIVLENDQTLQTGHG